MRIFAAWGALDRDRPQTSRDTQNWSLSATANLLDYMNAYSFSAYNLARHAGGACGVFEVGASANYRYSGYGSDNYVQSLSYTATVSYYFWEMCAWELDYTTGYSKQVSQGTSSMDPKETIEDNIQLTSLDLVLSFADRQATLRPYIKFGGGYLVKDRYMQVNDDNENLIEHQVGLVPSGGFGMAVTIVSGLSLKLGVDAWTSPLNQQPVIVDYAARAGISWMF